MLNLPQLVPHSRLPVLSVWSPTRVPMREAVTNVVRHAQAHTCCVEIDDEILVISDNGRGRGGAPEGNGLTGMRRRVEAAGGELWIGPGERGHGTRIVVTG